MKRIRSILLLSIMIVSLVLLIATTKTNNHIKKEIITVQEDLMEIKRIMVCEVLQVEENETPSDFDIAVEEMNQEMYELEAIEDKEEWFIAYKNIIEKYSYILDSPETIYDYFTEEELDLFARVVQAEVGDEYSFEQKCNVASVILNRIEDNRFGNTMFGVLTDDQFATIANERYKYVNVSNVTILACEYAFEIEDTTNGCLFFDSNGSLNYEFIFNDGAHNFYRIRDENSNNINDD